MDAHGRRTIALTGATDVADCLAHSMGRGGAADLAERDRRAAATFGDAGPRGRRPAEICSDVPSSRPPRYWVTMVTPVELGMVKPLEGLATEMVVRETPPPGLNDRPLGYDDAVRAALSYA